MKKETSHYQGALCLVNAMPRFYLGQEVLTKDGKGIIVDLKMPFNGLYIEPEAGEAVVWYGTQSSVHREEGGEWTSFTYRLKDLQIT